MHEVSKPAFSVLSPVAQAAGLSNVARSRCLPDRSRHPTASGISNGRKWHRRRGQASADRGGMSPQSSTTIASLTEAANNAMSWNV